MVTKCVGRMRGWWKSSEIKMDTAEIPEEEGELAAIASYGMAFPEEEL